MKSNFISYIFLSIVILGLFAQCSTKKNTGATRAYHYVTARYNVNFNAKQAFERGQQAVAAQHQDDFTQLLPIYYISNHNNAKVATSDMQRTVEKCQKSIKLHSIVKKPKRDPSKAKDPNYKAFMAKEEYNPMVQEAWLLMGKAQFYQLDFVAANATFSYVSRHFDDNRDVATSAQLWNARSYAEMGWFYEAEEVLKRMDEKAFTPKTSQEYVLVMADLLLKQGNYVEAVPFLETAIKEAKGQEKTRLYYILAQVHEKLNHINDAYTCYQQVLEHSPLHQMEFNALLAQARCYQGKDTAPILEKLDKLIKKQSNQEYLDQIYYTIALLYHRNGNMEKAEEYYLLAIESSTRDGIDKAKALLAMADIYYQKEQYVKAQPLYNEALPIIPANYPDYQTIEKRTYLLNDIARNEQIVVLEDSLQALAKLPEAEQIAIIEKVIEAKKKADQEEQKRLEEAARQQSLRDQNSALSQAGLSLGEIADKSWYFYNPTLITRGRVEFQKVWGKRILEDDWRRSNKMAMFVGEDVEAEEDSIAEGNVQEETQASQSNSPYDVAYHLRLIPTTPEKVEASNMAIQNALGDLFIIYNEKMGMHDKALEVYNELQRRFPQYAEMGEVRYRLYKTYERTNNPAEAQRIKQEILTKHAGSKYALLLENKLAEQQSAEQQAEQLYRTTYELFRKGDFSSVTANTAQAKALYPECSMMPKFMFLEALSTGKQDGKEAFKENLSAIIQKYPDSDVASMAKNMVALIGQGKEIQSVASVSGLAEERAKVVTETEYAENLQKAGFTYNPESQHLFICLVSGNDSIKNQVLYNIGVFNFTRFLLKDFDLQVRALSDSLHAVAVSGLVSLDEAVWYQNNLLSDAQFKQALQGVSYKAFVISTENFRAIFDKESVLKYLEFYRENQLKLEESDIISELKQSAGFVE
ncbi:MAG: tetratricopeptide repeat protein [Paludibacteraceae bacterium]|nr:tetratricopeptide repeat protein [Paludibacteraceae bacterium]